MYVLQTSLNTLYNHINMCTICKVKYFLRNDIGSRPIFIIEVYDFSKTIENANFITNYLGKSNNSNNNWQWTVP